MNNPPSSFLLNRISNLENHFALLKEDYERTLGITRNHLSRLGRGEHPSNRMLRLGLGYADLSPEVALALYDNPDLPFSILDVGVKRGPALKNHLHIPLEELPERFKELEPHHNYFVISERGVRSVLACALLVKKGLYNLSHISGGFAFFPGVHEANLKSG